MNKIFLSFILWAFFATASVAQTSSVSSDVAAQPQASYLYDLKKLIAKSREHIKEVNQKIKEQAALKRNQAREERARAYYEKGVELTNEGKFNEARDYFEKAIRITEHPEMAGYIRTSQQRLKKQESVLQAQEREHYHQVKQSENARKEDVEASYKEAVDLYKQKKYHPAKDAFEHVDEIAPDYKAVGSYLRIIDQDIIKADVLAAKQQAVEIARQQKEAEAARLKEKQMWMAQIEEKEKERKEAINKQAADVYAQAIELYKDKKFAQAKKKFEEVSWVIPNYKATIKYLKHIDRDAQVEGERAAREQQKALQQERWEQEVERKKQEALRQRELKAKKFQKKKDLQEQAQFLYTAAVTLFDRKNRAQALEKFNEVEKLFPNFKSTRAYIARIEHQPQAQAENPSQKKLADQRQREQELKDKTDQVKKIYALALRSYRARHWEESRAQFESVERMIPNFKHTRGYLQKIDDFIAREVKAKSLKIQFTPLSKPAITVPPAKILSFPNASTTLSFPNHDLHRRSSAIGNPAVNQNNHFVFGSTAAINRPRSAWSGFVAGKAKSAMPVQVKPVVSLEDQQQQAREITALAQKSAQLYRQIADISDDKYTAQTKRKMAQVDEILNNLRENKQRLLRQMREAQSKRQQEESKAKEEERRTGAKKMYQEAVGYLRSHDYAQAKIKFLALESIFPDYGATRRYLSRIEEYKKRAIVEAVITHEQKENAAKQTALQNLAQKASDINDDIIRLSRRQDYEAMKAKFTELENTVTALTALKKKKSQPAVVVPPAKNLSFPNVTTPLSFPNAATRPRMYLSGVGNPEKVKSAVSVETTRRVVSTMTVKQLESRREAVRKQLEDNVEAMYQEALSLYKKGDYTAAVDKFKDVQGIIPGYKRTGQYIHEASRKSLNSRPVITTVVSSLPVSRQENISQTLDLFDSHVQ